MAELGFGKRFVEPPDLPVTTIMCTNCGQILDPRGIIGQAPLIVPHFVYSPWDGDGASANEEIETEYLCPECRINLSNTPPRQVVIIYANAYPEIEDLAEQKYHLQKSIHRHRRNLRTHEEQLAIAGPLASQRVTLENLRDHEQEQVRILEQSLHTVERKIQGKLRGG